MNQHLINSNQSPRNDHRRRKHEGAEDALILNELKREMVIDELHVDNDRLELATSGNVRETCPKCQQPHLKLILRQDNVRLAHLFCAECESCFDAHYVNGASALTI